MTPAERTRAATVVEMAAGWGARLVVSDLGGVDPEHNERRLHLAWDHLADGTPKSARADAPACAGRGRHRAGTHRRFHEASLAEAAALDMCARCAAKAAHRETLAGAW